MSEGLKTTFETLVATENEAAVQALIPALGSTNRFIQACALRAILSRHDPAGHHEIIRRLHLLDEQSRAIVHQQRGSLTRAMRDAVQSTDPRLAANGCEAALWFHEYDLMPTLVSALEDTANSNSALAATTLLSLAELLDEELAGPRDYRGQRDPLVVRRNVVRCLEQSAMRYGMHRRLEPVEAFLLLVPRDNTTFKQVLLDPMHGSHKVMLDVLRHSQRPGIMRLVLGYLDDTHAPLSVLHVLAHRTDRHFVDCLLQKIGGEASTTAQSNLKRLDRFSWLGTDLSFVDALNDVAQHSVVQIIMASSMNRLEAFRVVEHLVAHGKTIGRRAAAVALAKFSGADANTLSLRLLKDEDPQVQATAARQLRHRGIPGALTMLIELVDSPHRLVRAAARESLAEFSFKRYLGAFDMLDEDVRRSTGKLVAKIDPETLPLLRGELESPSARRRMRGLAVAAAIGVAPQVENLAIALLYDDDHIVRSEAARLLGDCDGPTATAALTAALEDSSLVVKEAAADSLQRIAARPDDAPRYTLTSAELETADE